MTKVTKIHTAQISMSAVDRLRGVQRCLYALQDEAKELEEPLLAHLLGCCGLLAGERATEHEEKEAHSRH